MIRLTMNWMKLASESFESSSGQVKRWHALLKSAISFKVHLLTGVGYL